MCSYNFDDLHKPILIIFPTAINHCDHSVLPVAGNARNKSRKEYCIHLWINYWDTDMIRYANNISTFDTTQCVIINFNIRIQPKYEMHYGQNCWVSADV